MKRKRTSLRQFKEDRDMRQFWDEFKRIMEGKDPSMMEELMRVLFKHPEDMWIKLVDREKFPSS
jgi:hypothetical protein